MRQKRPRATTKSTPPTLVVGVGASAGGLEAFKQLLSALPADGGMAYLLVQHLDPTHKSLLTELLAPCTTLQVVEAQQGLTLRANTIYVIKPDTALAVRDGRLELTVPTLQRGVRLPVDHLFRSLAHEFGPASAGIVLSGAGSDGSAGVRALKAAGGLTIAQEPESSGQAGMPQSAIDTGAVDLILPISLIPAALARFASLPRSARASAEPDVEPESGNKDMSAGLADQDVGRLASVLEAQAEFDLNVYKPGTVQRRVLRRMTLTGYEDVNAYIAHLREDRREQQALVRDLLISVTDFFRDAAAFEALRTLVVDPLVAGLTPGDTIRVWVPGCATGEEAYSIAMELLDAIDRRGVRLAVQVFATDVDQDALVVGRTGLYSPALAEVVSQERLHRYFKRLDGKGYQIKPALRDVVSFAAHDVTKDPPFSRMHLVSCRNLLIYLRTDAQEHVLRVLHFALHPNGYLFLGSSESTGAQRGLYVTLSKRWRLFRKAGASKPLIMARSRMRPTMPVERPVDHSSPAQARHALGDTARRLVVQARVPPTLVVGDDGAVLFMHGELRPYLRFPDGEPRFDLAGLVSPDLATRVRAALYRCRRDHETVVALSSPSETQPRRVRITATPAQELGNEAVILTFEDVVDDAGAPPPLADTPAGSEQLVEQLERELTATREDLRNTVEELESSNEELRSSNEESMSMNEELQSANEELEATTEELRSLNEELTTVNAQLRDKVELLEQAHDDLTNFFDSSKIATLFLDERLCIKRFTPAAEDLVRIDHSDEGRFVGDIARELLQNGLVEQGKHVLEHLTPQTQELQMRDGRWITRRTLPYRTESRRIEGVVITFTDVTELKQTAERLSTRERQQAVIARLGLRALEETDLQTFLDQAVREVQRTLATDFCMVLELQPGGGQLLLRAGVGWRADAVGTAIVGSDVNSQAGFTLAAKQPVIVEDLASERRFTGPPLLTEHGVASGVSCVIHGSDGMYGVLGAHTRTRRAFTDEDAYFLQATASVIAGAISRHETRVQLAIEGTVARALVDASSLREAASAVHEAASTELGSGVSELWMVTSDESLVRDAAYAHGALDAVQARPVDDETPDHAALASRVAAAGAAEWVSMPGAASGQPETPPSRLALLSGVALPIVQSGHVIGVFAHFSCRRFHADRLLLRSLESIGRTLGDFKQRIDADRRIRATIDRAPVGIADRSLDGRWLRVNDRLCSIVGHERAELIGQPFSAIVHPEDIEREHSLVEAMAAGTLDRYAIEKRYMRKDGAIVWVSVGAALVEQPTGDADYCVVVIEDISARKKAEDDLRESEARFREILRNSPVPMVVYDDAGTIVAISDSWTDFTGYTLADIPTAEDWIKAAYRENAEQMREMATTVWGEEPRPHRYEHQIWTKAGQPKTVLLSAVPIGSSSDGRRLRVAAAMDLTAQKAYEHEMDLASRQKDEFIAMLSHELRNPLAAVRTATELLKRADVRDATVQRVQKVMERQSSHMARLLDGLLDISRIIRGKIQIERVPVDFAAIVRDAADDHGGRIRSSGLALTVEVPAEPIWVLGDRVRLTQIVDNLLTNAAKFTPPPGNISIHLAVAGGDAVLRVRDSGVGIDPELLPRLFEVFQQGPQNIDRTQGGLGVGLALVRLLVDLHGGAVSVASAGATRGSEFSVSLPITAERPGAGESASAHTGGRRILIIEDNADAAEMLRVGLTLQGHEVRTAADGGQGISLAREFQPDAIVCDLGLPGGVTGYDVATALRQEPATRDIQLIALSGYGRPDDKQRAREAGFDTHFTKPVSLEELGRALARSAASPAASTPGDAADRSAD